MHIEVMKSPHSPRSRLSIEGDNESSPLAPSERYYSHDNLNSLIQKNPKKDSTVSNKMEMLPDRPRQSKKTSKSKKSSASKSKTYAL